ncbi:uncharacterized protein LOC143293491 [Babylonia areolata]|uniref:uncharacterized protein LOC143293491 n=1 Tax=Babylonia areolata TaxID=304850 RepID=UPI003FD224AA
MRFALCPLALVMVVTTLTLTLPSVDSEEDTTTTAQPSCGVQVDAIDTVITIDEGSTKSVMISPGKGYIKYTCTNAATGETDSESVDCQPQCVSPINKPYVDGVYQCVDCYILYDNATDCADDVNDSDCNQKFLNGECLDDPEGMIKTCCKTCQDNTSEETTPSD